MAILSLSTVRGGVSPEEDDPSLLRLLLKYETVEEDRSQILRVLSKEPDTKDCPSGEKDTEYTEFVWPVNRSSN